MNQVLSHLTEEERKIADEFEFSETVQALLSTINTLRERVEAAEGWVACEDRFPEIGQWVQLYCESGHVTAWCIGRPIPWKHCNAKVTHWKPMSVPPSPKAEEQSNGK